MITEYDLQEAIAECRGKRNPDASTCIKLAAFLTIKEHLFPDEKDQEPELTQPAYSYAAPPAVEYDSDTEFARAIKGLTMDELLPVMDELMSTIQMLNPALYNGVMRRLQ